MKIAYDFVNLSFSCSHRDMSATIEMKITKSVTITISLNGMTENRYRNVTKISDYCVSIFLNMEAYSKEEKFEGK